MTFIGITKVFAIKEGKAVELRVSTGVQDSQSLEVTAAGLSAGDQVAITGVSRLANGVPVEVKSAAAASQVPPSIPNTKLRQARQKPPSLSAVKDRGVTVGRC